jgi:hypothetical protein
MANDDFFNTLTSHIEEFVDQNPGKLSIAAATGAQTLVDMSQGVYGILSGHGSEVADLFDQKVEQSNAFIRSFGNQLVDENPGSKGAVLAATALSAIPGTFMEFGKGTVDSARLGTGFAEGTWTGAGKDVLRALPFLTPAFRASKSVYGTITRAYLDPAKKLGTCVPVSITKALAQTGQTKAFVALSDMVKRVVSHPAGRASIDQGRSLKEMAGDLYRIGAEFKLAKSPQTMQELEKLVRANKGGVTVFGLEWQEFRSALNETVKEGHAMYAYIDGFGRFRIADNSKRVVGSLKELVDAGYKQLAKAQLHEHIMQIPMSRFLKTMQEGGSLGIAVNAMRTTSWSELRDTAKDFMKSKQRKSFNAPASAGRK